MLKYFVKIFIANKRSPPEVYVFLTDCQKCGQDLTSYYQLQKLNIVYFGN